jgi:hypothetical protein
MRINLHPSLGGVWSWLVAVPGPSFTYLFDHLTVADEIQTVAFWVQPFG